MTSSTERADLLAIGKALKIFDAHKLEEKPEECNNIDLLKSIVKFIQSAQNTPSAQQKATDTVEGRLRNLDESFAFPPKVRNKLQGKDEDQIEAGRFWLALVKLNDMLRQDYTYRRTMLLNRLDCTIESFKWKNSNNNKIQTADTGTKTVNDLIHEKYETARVKLRNEPQINLPHLLAVRRIDSDRLLNSVISSRRTDCKISYKPTETHQRSGNQPDGKLTYLKQVLIPDVPDRGGRTNEIKPPTKETFNQQRHNRSRGGGFRR